MQNLIEKFNIKGKVKSIHSFGNGHINKTFLVKTTKEDYVFQFVNFEVFRNIESLMKNISRVTEHLRSKGETTLHFLETKDGSHYVKSCDDYLRGYHFLPNSICYERPVSLVMVNEMGKGLGRFHKNLVDIDIEGISEAIPDFHNTKKRFADFLEAIKKNKADRLFYCQEDVDFAISRKEDYPIIEEGISNGKIGLRITHNDPKVNNFAFDQRTNQVCCLIDLDTVMLGSYLYDFGDALRSLFTGENESNFDTRKIAVDFDIYRAFLDGYYKEMVGALNDYEIELLPFSALLMTEELVMRFLGDFLNGDTYFNAKYPTHNLIRARTQIALSKDIIKHYDELKAITKEIVEKYGK